MALNLFVLKTTDSALLMGVFMALRLGAGFVVGPVAGALATRFPRPLVMVGCDALAATGLILLVIAPASFQSVMLYPLAIAMGACQTTWSVAMRSGVPDVVGSEQRVRANGVLVTSRSLALVAGLASAGFIVAQWGYEVAFLIDAATYVTSALLLVVVWRGTRSSAGAATSAPAGDGKGSLRLAIAFLATATVLPAMIAIRTLDAVGSASHIVALPIYATRWDPGNPAAFSGSFWAAWALGMLLASRVARRFLESSVKGTTKGEMAFAIGTGVMSLFFILPFTNPWLPFVLAVAFAAGLADGFTEIAYTSRLQSVDNAHRGHVFGFAMMAQNAGLGLGMLASAVALDNFAPIVVVAISHGSAMTLALIFLVGLRRRRASQNGLDEQRGTRTVSRP